MFFKTLFVGGLIGFIASIFINWSEYMKFINPFNGLELLGVILFFLGYALVFTVISQTGFFAYLFIHRFGENFFKSFWPMVQILLVAFALFDMIYFSSKGIPLLYKWGMVGVIVIVAVLTSMIKARKTNFTAFIPAMFVMIVITALELSLVLRAGDVAFIILMLVPVLTANAYQLLILHKVTEVDPEHQRRMEERRKRRLAMQKGKQTVEKKKS
jgi:KinB signaling pathway activation protein